MVKEKGSLTIEMINCVTSFSYHLYIIDLACYYL